MATMNISLPDKLKEWVESQVASGQYANVSDYVRDLIRREQERKAFVFEIEAAVEAGVASGFVPYSREELEREIGLNKTSDAA